MVRHVEEGTAAGSGGSWSVTLAPIEGAQLEGSLCSPGLQPMRWVALSFQAALPILELLETSSQTRSDLCPQVTLNSVKLATRIDHQTTKKATGRMRGLIFSACELYSGHQPYLRSPPFPTSGGSGTVKHPDRSSLSCGLHGVTLENNPTAQL